MKDWYAYNHEWLNYLLQMPTGIKEVEQEPMTESNTTIYTLQGIALPASQDTSQGRRHIYIKNGKKYAR